MKRSKMKKRVVFTPFILLCSCLAMTFGICGNEQSPKPTEPPEEPVLSSPNPSLQEQMKYFNWLMKLYQDDFDALFQEKAPVFIAANPDFSENDEIMFYQMKSYRYLKKWKEARDKANEIIQKYPESGYTAKMGGINGRTEDQAAFDYAYLVKDYHEKRFEECIEKVEDYMKFYPNNWRIPQAYCFYSYALYHSGNKEKFFRISDKFLNESLNPGQNDHISFLQATMLVKQGQYQDAFILIEKMKTRYPESDIFHKFLELRLECFYKQKDYAGLEREADEIIKQYPQKGKKWCTAMAWKGIAMMNSTPPKTEEALPVFESMLEGNLSDTGVTDENIATAAIWRIWIAEEKGDRETAKKYMKKVKTEMKEGVHKKRVMERFESLLNE